MNKKQLYASVNARLYLSSENLSFPEDSVTPSGTASLTLDGQEIRNPISAMNNIIFVKVKETLSSTSGGILLPDQSKQRPTEGFVIASGPGKLHPYTSVRIPNPIDVGMSVV